MATPSDTFKLRKSFFHVFGKTNTTSTQAIYESRYKSLGNITTQDVWTDSVGYAYDETAAGNEASTNSAVTKYTQSSLTYIPGSNRQAYYLEAGGSWIRPWINPVDVPHPSTNNPSFGYELKLYNSSGTQIPPTEGVWVIDYYAGMVMFQEGYTPVDQGYGTPKITCYAYTGSTLEEESVEPELEFQFDCTGTEQVGDAVYIYNSGEVRQASALSIGTSNVIGFIIEKPTNITCIVSIGGIIDDFNSLSIGSQYFLSITLGQISTSIPIGGGRVIAPLGKAITTTGFAINLSSNATIRS